MFWLWWKDVSVLFLTFNIWWVHNPASASLKQDFWIIYSNAAMLSYSIPRAEPCVSHFLPLSPPPTHSHTLSFQSAFSLIRSQALNALFKLHNQLLGVSNHAQINTELLLCVFTHPCVCTSTSVPVGVILSFPAASLIGWATGRAYLYLSWHTALSTTLHRMGGFRASRLGCSY